jgi:hypothetical protein
VRWKKEEGEKSRGSLRMDGGSRKRRLEEEGRRMKQRGGSLRVKRAV